ncbi:MAG: glycosyltransferase family 9 protein [Fimbriimonadaceae bacterium]|nr:glycosyltransferase family 9 protein [Fimbriimonadaceae bacterium]
MATRFLISRLSSLGDVVCSLPAAAALKAGFDDSHIVWIVDRRFAGIVECCRFVDEVMVAAPGLHPRTWPKPEGHFEAALDLQGLFKSSIAIGRAKAVHKLGYHWQREASGLFSHPVTPDDTSWHIVDQYVDVARAAGGKAGRAEFGLEPHLDDKGSVQQKLRDIGVSGRFVAINAGAGWVTKRWPASSYAALIGRLAEAGLQTVLIGGKASADREAANDVVSGADSKPIDMLGQTSVRELVALISMSEAHIGGDTGSTHIAAALDKPAIGLYSITRPKRSCPYGQVERCLYDPSSLANIGVVAVFEKVMEAVG